MWHRLAILFLHIFITSGFGQARPAVLAVYTGKNDLAHISFIKEANVWFAEMAKAHGFTYRASNDWNQMHTDTLARYSLLIFLDSRPDSSARREAFEKYMKNGGGWMGFHFAGFALTSSTFPQNWNWYHNEFLASGEYLSNTWRPTSAIVAIEDPSHPIMKGIPDKFRTSPNEWYRWEKDLRDNKAIKILASIHQDSFPLGTGPKPHEIWREGYYPVIWTNTLYRMVYFNMGHNDIDYDGKTNRGLSLTFDNQDQNQMILNTLAWLLFGG